MSYLEELQKKLDKKNKEVLTEQNAAIETFLKSVMNNSIDNIDTKKETLVESEEQMNESDDDDFEFENNSSDVDADDNQDENAEETESDENSEQEDVSNDNDEVSDEIESSDEENEMDDEVESDLPIPSVDEPTIPFEDGDEVIDMVNASAEEVLDKMKDLPDDTEVVIVKQSTFDVKSNPTVLPSDAVSDIPNEEMPTIPSIDDEESEMPIDSEDDELDNDNEGTDYEEMSDDDENVDGMDDSDEEDIREQVIMQHGQLIKYEGIIKKLRESMKDLINENKSLKNENDKAVKTLSEAYKSLQSSSLTNHNLLHVVKLFTEHKNVSKNDKTEILKEFDTKVSNQKESKLIYESWDKLLTTKNEKNNIPFDKKEVTQIKTSVLNENVKTDDKKVNLNESVSYENKQSDRVMQMFNYKA